MGFQDEYIEHETEDQLEFDRSVSQITPLFRNFNTITQEKTPDQIKKELQEEALSLHLEMEEEIAFQRRLNKEQEAINKIKDRINQEIERKVRCLKEMNSTKSSIGDVFIQHYFPVGSFEKKNKLEQSHIKDQLKNINLKGVVENEINSNIRVLKKIHKNIPYLIESLYMDFYRARAMDRKDQDYIKYGLLNEPVKLKTSILDELEKFLSEEFHTFFAYCKKMPGIDSDIYSVSKEKVEKNNKLFMNMIPDYLKEAKDIFNGTINRIETKLNPSDPRLNDLRELLLSGMDHIQILEEHFEVSLNDFVTCDAVKNSSKAIDTQLFPIWEDMRFVHREIFYYIKELKQKNSFIDDLEKEYQSEVKIVDLKPRSEFKKAPKKAPKKVDNSLEFTPKDAEIVPELDDTFLLPVDPLKEKEEKLKFIERKRIQLQLWKARVQERKIKQDSNISKVLCIQPQSDSKDMPVKMAELLLELNSKMSKNDQLVFNSFFEANGCKPHNFLFQNIESLVEHMGGQIKFPNSGSSHFAIKLPNTYSDGVKKVVGGSYTPHAHGEQWNLNAHILCKQAFEKAGITPERIKIAKQINSKPEEEKGVKYGARK